MRLIHQVAVFAFVAVLALPLRVLSQDAPTTLPHTEVFVGGTGAYHTYRIPAIVARRAMFTSLIRRMMASPGRSPRRLARLEEGE